MNARQEVDFLIIGGGMAAGNCAAELRKSGADGSVLIVGREPDPPYERPPLSKDYLRGDSERSDAYVNPPDWYEQNDVQLRTKTNVTGLDPSERIATLQGGEEVAFEKALVATGANVNILRVDGSDNDGIHYLRAFGNSDAIRESAEEAEHVLIVGGSYIGCEVAASLTAQGKSCTIIAMEEVALSRTFGDEAGRYFHDILTSKGVEFAGAETLASFEGDGGRVAALTTESGKRFEGQMAVVGAGVRPDTMLLDKAGLDVDNGVLCDSKLETSAPGIFAAGDVCNYESVVHGRRLRVEHWDVAFQQGHHAARAMLGSDEPYTEVPYFFSDLADWASLEYVGPAQSWDETIWRGSADDGEFSVFYLDGGRVVAALAVGRSEDLTHARRLLEAGTDLSGQKDKLADTDTELDEVG